jgi:hypothetical protein
MFRFMRFILGIFILIFAIRITFKIVKLFLVLALIGLICHSVFKKIA